MKRRGVTIIELILYMSILSFLLLFFTDLFATMVNKQLETESVSNVQQDANYLLSRLSYDFSRAEVITLPLSPGAPESILELTIDSVPTRYFLNSGFIVMQQNELQYVLNSSQTTISNVTFQRLGMGNANDVVQVKFDITSNTKQQSGYEVTHFSTTLGIREK